MTQHLSSGGPQMDPALCERLLDVAGSHCIRPEQLSAPAASGDNMNALAAAIAAQANWLTFWTGAIAVLGVLLAIGWGWLVKNWAEKAARDEVRRWMEERAQGQIADMVSELVPTFFDGGLEPGPGTAAATRPLTQEEQEAGLGEES